MATLLGTIGVKLKADTTEFIRGVGAAEKELREFKSEMVGIGTALATIGAGFAVVGAKSVATAADFQSTMTRVGVVTNATSKEFGELKKTALELAKTTKFSAKEVAEGMKFMGMAGASTTEIAKGIEPALNLAAAGAIELGDAANIVTNIMKGFGMEMDELTAAGDAIIKTITSTNVDVQQLGESFKHVAPVARSAGLEFEEVTAALGLLGNAGIQGSLAGTTLKNAITRLLNPTGEVEDTLKDLNIELTDSEGKMLSFTQIIDRLGPHAQNTGAMMKIFGLRAGPGLAALVGEGADAINDLTAELLTSKGTMAKIASAEMATFSGQMKIIAAQTEGIGIVIGETLMPALRVLATGLQIVLEGFLDLSPLTRRLIVVLGGLAAAFATVSGAGLLFLAFFPKLKVATVAAVGLLGSLKMALATVKVEFMIFRIRAFAALAPLFSMKTLVPTLKAAWIAFLPTLKKVAAMMKVMGATALKFLAILTAITTAIGQIQLIRTALKDPAEARKQIFELTGEDITTKGLFGGIGTAIEAGFHKGLNNILDPMKKAFDALTKEDLPDFSNQLNNAADTAKKRKDDLGLGDNGDKGRGKKGPQGFDFSTVSDYTADLMADELEGPLTKALDDLNTELDFSKLGKDEYDRVEREVESATGAVKPQTLQDKINKSLNDIAPVYGEGAKVLADSFLSGSGLLGETFAAASKAFAVGGPVGAISAALATLFSKTGFFSKLVGMLNGVLGGVVKGMDDILAPLSGMIGPLGELLGTIVKVFSALLKLWPPFMVLGNIAEWLGKAINKVTETIVSIWNKILGTLADLVDKIPGLGKTAKAIRKRMITVEGEATEENARAIQEQFREQNQAILDMLKNSADGAMGDVTNDLTESLSSVPQGFKVAAARFNAMMADPVSAAGVTPGATGAAAAGTAKGPEVAIDGDLIIQTNDPEGIAEQVIQGGRRRNFAQKGTPSNVGTPFSITTGVARP